MNEVLLLLFGQHVLLFSWVGSPVVGGASCLAPGPRMGLGIVLAAVGIWGMLPNRRLWTRRISGLVAATGAGLVVSLAPTLGGVVETVLFWSMAGIAIVSAAAMITARNPIYSALWFALALLGTAGLFLINGAQFLAVATVAVYAGAIVVIFLFVLMLSKSDGHEFYDRISWGNIPSLLASFSGAALLGLVAWLSCGPDMFTVVSQSAASEADLATADHVAAMGSQLFTHQLIAVQVAALLLMVALVGAIAISMRGKQMQVQSSQNAVANGTDSLVADLRPASGEARS